MSPFSSAVWSILTAVMLLAAIVESDDTLAPTLAPSFSPTDAPSGSPSQPPTATPTQPPTTAPTDAPSMSPTTCLDVPGIFILLSSHLNV